MIKDLEERLESALKTCGHCGEPWPCSDVKRKDISGFIRAAHHIKRSKP